MAKKKENLECANCEHHQDTENVEVIICTRFPPQGSRPSLFPTVQSNWRCGEYEKETK